MKRNNRRALWALASALMVFMFMTDSTAFAAVDQSGTLQSTFKNFFLPPGIAKKVQRGGMLPPGIAIKIAPIGSTTPPITLPLEIYNLSVHNISQTAAEFSWLTLTGTRGTVYLSTSSAVTPEAPGTMSSSSTTYSMFHFMRVTDLSPGTTYYYFAVSTDGSGNTATSSIQSFMTRPSVVSYPSIYNVWASSTSPTSETIHWWTVSPATSYVWYGTSTNFSLLPQYSASSTDLVLHHIVRLFNLATSTTYYYTVVSANASGTATTTGLYFFK